MKLIITERNGSIIRAEKVFFGNTILIERTSAGKNEKDEDVWMYRLVFNNIQVGKFDLFDTAKEVAISLLKKIVRAELNNEKTFTR